MFERVTVIGAGVAGCAAAWAAAQRGAEIRIFDAGVGASSLASGAIDDRPWEEVARSTEVLGAPAVAGVLPGSLRTFADDLGLWKLPAEGEPLARLVTEAGRIRVARGHERGLLDLSALPRGARVVLPRLARVEWHPESLARALHDDAYAREKGLRFDPIDASILKHGGEDRITAADLAARHDDPERRGWLVERLRELVHRADRVDAILLGPWLGTREPLAEAVSEALGGIPVGELVTTVGGAVGLRFEAARTRLLALSGLDIEPIPVEAIEPAASASDADEMAITLTTGERVSTDAVVLAIGGMVSGGVIYDPPEQRAGPQYADAGGEAFRLSVALPDVAIQAQGRHLDIVGSMHGPPLEATAWPRDADPGFLEAVGVRAEGIALSPRIFAAGDVVADKPRTILQAAFHGIHAGAAAAGEPGAIAS